jgi:NADPH:quinone reductase-like Zn-dependent oxidoreductase
MKAIHLRARGGPEQLVFEDANEPTPARNEALVRVHASGVTPTELLWGENWRTRTGETRSRPIPGHELAGVVAAIGPGVRDVQVGQAVIALVDFDRDGADAELVAVPSEVLAPKPGRLDWVQAAAVPLSGLTAWQALFDHAHLEPGQHVLIHGAAGGVGTFAVQLAHWRGARVVGTASPANAEFLRSLGCDQVIDYHRTRFEDVVRDVDVVLDCVGGDTLARSYPVLRSGGVLVSIVERPSAEEAEAHGARAVFFIVEPDRAGLTELGRLIDAGAIAPIIAEVLPLAEARQAFERGLGGHVRGKIVLRVAS